MKRRYNESHICIYDDLVPTALQEDLTAMVRRPIWEYGWRSNVRRDRFCFWHAHFAGKGIDSREDCEAQLKGRDDAQAFYALWSLLKEGPLRGHALLRAYANAHTYGVEGYVHTDNDDMENYFSTVYYAHPVWHPNWAGQTAFFSPDRCNVLRSVYPQPGRVVSFPGSIPHCAHGPSRDCAELRVSLVLKTHVSER